MVRAVVQFCHPVRMMLCVTLALLSHNTWLRWLLLADTSFSSAPPAIPDCLDRAGFLCHNIFTQVTNSHLIQKRRKMVTYATVIVVLPGTLFIEAPQAISCPSL